MQARIRSKLQQIEHEQATRIVWAVESGSRAWGFASPDSDYDVRGVGIQMPEAYLQIDAASEGFEWIEDTWFDVGVWDIRKCLRLLRGSNAVVLEWLQSPQVYQADWAFHAQIWDLAQACFQAQNVLYHYRGVAKTASAAFQTDGSIRLKKWFYVLRPLLAAHWVVRQQSVPPMTLDALLQDQTVAVQERLAELVAFKATQAEEHVFVPDASLQALLGDLWQQTEQLLPKRTIQQDEALNHFFRTWVGA